MSKFFRSSGVTRLLVCTAVGLAPIGFSLSAPLPCRAHPITSQNDSGQDPGGQDVPKPNGQVPGDDGTMPRRNLRSKASAKKGQSSSKKTSKKSDATGRPKKGATRADSASSGGIKFSQDVAPILVANCIGCHSGDNVGVRRGKLDLTTFENLMKGSQKRKDDPEIVLAGKPDESHLVLRLKGEEEPRMPQGGQNRMSDEAIAAIERWVKEGAKLDAGIDPKKPMKSYAATPEQLARNQMAKLPPAERDKKVEAVGRERWKQANPKLKPEVVPGEHFMMFSNLPNDRATTTIKAMETQYGHLKRMIGSPATDWVEKVSLYVFSSRNDFIEFVRSVESREVDVDAVASAKMMIAQPYLAVVDPGGGSSRREEPAAGKRRGRSRRGAEAAPEAGAGDRTLVGLLTESLGSATLACSGNTPRWLSEGFGSYMAAQLEPRSPYFRQLRQTAFANYDQGWRTKANEALGGSDQITADGLHSIGFALVEAMMSEMRQGFPAFLKGMVQGGEKLDEVLQLVYGGTREEFLDGTGEWVATHYRGLQ